MNTKYKTHMKDNLAFAVALAAAAVGIVAILSAGAIAKPTQVAEVQRLDTIVVTAPRLQTVQLDTIVVTASRSEGKLVVAAKQGSGNAN